MIDKKIMKGIAEMTANFLLPCLSISEICKSFNISNLGMWIPIVLYCFLNVILGFIIGVLVCLITRPKSAEVRRLILVTCMFNNSTSMQLIYVETLSGLLAKMINVSETEAKSRGYVIVLTYNIFVNFLRWSIGYNLMKPDKHYLPIQISNRTVEEVVQVTDSNKIKFDDIRNPDENKKTCFKILKEGMNMPFIAGIFAIVISSIPKVSTFFSDKNSFGYKLLVGIEFNINHR
jgi:predicted permease